jgi:hypothetical protein
MKTSCHITDVSWKHEEENITGVVSFSEKKLGKGLLHEIRKRQERKGIMWWKVGVRRLKGLRRDVEIGIYPLHMEEDMWNMLE